VDLLLFLKSNVKFEVGHVTSVYLILIAVDLPLNSRRKKKHRNFNRYIWFKLYWFLSLLWIL